VRTLSLAPEHLAALRRFADEAYPEECCGYLLSPPPGAGPDEVRQVVDLVPAANRSSEERGRRYVILPEELRRTEREAEDRGVVVAGFYHSHPDHPARPSAFDQEHAWPWYAYVIVASGPAHGATRAGAFELDPDRREFEEIGLAVGAPASPPTVRTVGKAE